jgi:4-diphosphocytidyl-2-C-methyl-D-erythritol kinase
VLSFPSAKINLGLRIVGKRADGFHSIETVFYPVGWCDVLEVIENKSASKAEIDFTISGNDSLSADDNLCVRAYRLLKKDFPLPAVKAHLHKLIPVGAGLGGGSSDAASMILLLNKLFGLKMSNSTMKQYALQLGSDCPFFINSKPAHATGRGEVLSEIPDVLKNYFICIVKPSFSISTAEAYSMVKPAVLEKSLQDLIKLPVSEWRNAITNDFEIPLAGKFPELAALKKKFYDAGAVFSLLSGSGSAVYGIFEKKVNGKKLLPGMESWNGPLHPVR